VTDDPRAGQEAARLLATAQDWLRTSAPHLAPVGDDGETCSCPLCRVVVSVRDVDPDVVGRWVDAAVAAATGALAQAGSPTSPTDPDPEPDAAPAESASSDATDEPGRDAPADDVGDPAGTGQDAANGRRVRTIPVERETGDPER
jgi:hypothetical protein